MKTKIIYLTHWRFPSEKTMTPLIMKTCTGFIDQGFETELWIPWRRNPGWTGRDPFAVHAISVRFLIRRIFSIDLLSTLGTLGFIIMLVTFNLSAYMRLFFGNRKEVILYAHDVRDVLLPCLLGYSFFVEIHDFYESSHQWINRLVFKRASGLIVTNSIKQKHIHEHYGVPLDKMIRQPNAVDYAFFQITESKSETRKLLGLSENIRMVLYTGHLFSWKGVDTLALASAMLPLDTEIYFVGGTDSDRASLQKFVLEKDLPRIKFISHQSHDRIPLYMRAADVLVLPNTGREDASKYETSPVKLFEYLSSHTPVVASDLPSIRDIVTESEVTFFEADNPDSLSEAIQMVLVGGESIERKISNADTKARSCSWESRGKAIADLIRRNP